jgi:methionine synthase II (cobalamin-independent)
MKAPTPGIVATTMLNQHYDSHEAYLTALAKAPSNEYRAIHNAGMILQIDAPGSGDGAASVLLRLWMKRIPPAA